MTVAVSRSLLLSLALMVAPWAMATGCPAHSQGHLAVIIDDLGYNLERASEMAAIPAPLTLAIIPGTPHAETVAALGNRHGKEIMVHMPMSSNNREVSDPVVLEQHLSREHIGERVRQAVTSVPGAAGMNNHMGSALTADQDAMDALMAELAALDMYFIDSRTTRDTVAVEAASAWGVAIASRSVFLDNQPTAGAIALQFNEAVDLALSEGYAIAIGHPHAATIAVLNDALPKLPPSVTVVSASQIAQCQTSQSRTSTP